jgi:hypothetical protein
MRKRRFTTVVNRRSSEKSGTKPVPAAGRSVVQKEKKEYVAPEIEKREKLGEVAGMPTTVSGATG